MDEAIISIRPQWAARILSGQKSFEVRTRRVLLAPSTRLWMYTTLPVGRIEIVARIEEIIWDEPRQLWKMLGLESRVREYSKYINGHSILCVMRLGEVSRLKAPPDLSSLRKVMDGFHPPQFYSRLGRGGSLVRYLEKVPVEQVVAGR